MIDADQPQHDDDDTAKNERFVAVLSGARAPAPGDPEEAQWTEVRRGFLRRRRSTGCSTSGGPAAVPTDVASQGRRPWLPLAIAASVTALAILVTARIATDTASRRSDAAIAALRDSNSELRASVLELQQELSETRQAVVHGIAPRPPRPALPGIPGRAPKGDPAPLETSGPEAGFALGSDVGIWLQATLDACDEPKDIDWMSQVASLEALASSLQQAGISHLPQARIAIELSNAVSDAEHTSEAIRETLCNPVHRNEIYYAIHDTRNRNTRIDDTG